jgi:hypothetical protein
MEIHASIVFVSIVDSLDVRYAFQVLIFVSYFLLLSIVHHPKV